ncbi:hypothetical protein BV898_07787 [Hypsibius exemplaris]|uniref:Mediator of RNA polymerase II transcription subunit 30 n=1 Tax=Hypsibius exemplaris TaxID=2072580 RepID=A0A1W0WSL3_HYPEX|nr:hypothetical protein BV898_07787 [Hypsibius exemplaris]
MDQEDAVDYLGIIRYGEDLLTEVMQRVTDVLYTGKQVGIPVDRTQLQMTTKRILVPLEEQLKMLPALLKRLAVMDEIIVNLLNSYETPNSPEELIPLRSDPVGALPASFDEEMIAKVPAEQWAEYLDLREKILKRDAYLKTIIDTERAILQEVNCVTHPF